VTDEDLEKRADVRVVVKVKNALILRKMEEMGISSVSELSRRSGISNTQLGAFVNMRKPGRSEHLDNEWRTASTRLAKFLRCLPEDLFSDEQQYRGLRTNVASRDVSMDDIRTLMIESTAAKDPEQLMLEDEGARILGELLATLTPREHRMLTLRFGLDGKGERTLDRIAEEWSISRERVRQIEGKALRRLKHPARAAKLRPYVRDIAGFDPTRREDR